MDARGGPIGADLVCALVRYRLDPPRAFRTRATGPRSLRDAVVSTRSGDVLRESYAADRALIHEGALSMWRGVPSRNSRITSPT